MPPEILTIATTFGVVAGILGSIEAIFKPFRRLYAILHNLANLPDEVHAVHREVLRLTINSPTMLPDDRARAYREYKAPPLCGNGFADIVYETEIRPALTGLRDDQLHQITPSTTPPRATAGGTTTRKECA